MKPIILLVGVDHFDKSNLDDVLKGNEFDVLEVGRQHEIKQFVNQLASFSPTKICVEIVKDKQEQLTRNYQDYLSGEQELRKGEIDQIGFRLAKQMNLSTIEAVDWQGEIHADPFHYGTTYQVDQFQEILDGFKRSEDELGAYLSNLPIGDYLHKLNELQRLKAMHRGHLRLTSIGSDEDPVGIEWLTHYWMYRNLRIYQHLLDVAREDERLLVLYGASHIYPLKQLFVDGDLVNVQMLEDLKRQPN
ncbi:DUF5694 domain-containing protein [Alkalihalobacillus sp. LMS6]|uniref:DUF5694 domain-containing protein n=2 Tax=Bacillaceae TaxID=186817 RepID=UPI0020D14A3A|nr:DUF5694 domain-containing protein [Alkalihalobacillus sp. LMS6]UTR05993.1 DUF5694 domain-containing protein [Alkalihalobacillus sp. LMS6]